MVQVALQFAVRQLDYTGTMSVKVIEAPKKSIPYKSTPFLYQGEMCRKGYVPLRMKFKSGVGFNIPASLPLSQLTDLFFAKLSKRKCSASRCNCSLDSRLSRKVATFSISPYKSCK